MKKSSYTSIFSIILWINLCSIVILSMFNYYVLHSKSNQAYLESFLKYQQNVTELAFNNIDNQVIQSVLKIAQLHFSPIKENEPLLIAQDENIGESSQKILELTTEMKKIQKTYPYITQIDVYYEATQTVVTAFDKVHFIKNENLLETYLPWYEDYSKGEKEDGFQYNPEGVYLDGATAITYIKKISRPKWHGKNIVLAISVNPDSFSQYIDTEEGNLQITDRAGRVLYDSFLEQDKKREGEGVDVFKKQSEVTGLTYHYSVDAGLFFADYKITSRKFLTNFFISIGFNLVVLLLISYYSHAVYRKRVQALTEKAGLSMGGTERSFDQSLHVLTNELSNLHAAVQSSKGMLFQNAVRSSVLNRKMEEGGELISPYMNGDAVCAYLIFLPEPEMEALSIEALQDEFPPGEKGYDVMFTAVEKDSLAALLVFKDGEWKSAHEDFMEQMGSHWKQFQMVSGHACKVKSDGIRTSYKSAKEAERYRFILTEKTYLSADEIHVENRKESGSHLKLFDAIKKDINNQDLLQVKAHLEMIVTSFKSGSYTIEYCNSTLRDFVTLLYQVMQQYQLDMWIVFGYDIREYYKKIPNIDVFYTWCDNLCEMLLKNIYQKKQAIDIDIRTEMLRLIDENLENNITLDFLAERLRMRPDTASRTFRQMMGVGYAEYIKTRKLERGLELMAQGYSVKDIAEKLGYSTSQYFIKVFKETYGVTPHQYKKNMNHD